jgi:hypothetical protein
MAKNYVHRRYYRIRDNSGNLITFLNTKDANSKINFRSAWQTCSPIVTDILEQGNQVLCKTFEFESDQDQVNFKSAIDALWETGNPWLGNDAGTVEYMRVEWLDTIGNIEFTKSFL